MPTSRTSPRRPEAGFTLIEVLIAIAVLAIALSALLRQFGAAADLSAALRDRTLAGWVAQDHRALRQARRDWPALGSTSGARELGGSLWRWREEVSTATVPRLRRVRIEVLKDGQEAVLAELAFLLRERG